MFSQYLRLGLPVWASDREVIKAASRKVRKAARYDRRHRDVRHRFYRNMLQHHKDAGEQYTVVMRGW